MTGHAAEQERDDIPAACLTWFEGRPDLDPDRLIFIDGEEDQKSIHRGC